MKITVKNLDTENSVKTDSNGSSEKGSKDISPPPAEILGSKLNSYTKENIPLRPFLFHPMHYVNVEENVSTLKCHTVNYLMVEEEKPPLQMINRKLESAPTKTSKMMEAKLEYERKLAMGIRSRMRALAAPKPKIDGNCHNVNFTETADMESFLARERDEAK